MNVPSNLLFSKTHEWVRIEENIAYLGLTDFAQDKLGQIVFVDLPELNQEIKEKEQVAEVESVKAVAEFFSPVSGKVVKVNEDLLDSPEQINENPYDSWFVAVELSDQSELENLLNPQKYEALLMEEEENH
ncbi:MAG: glycine cleavage system protein GcvH [Clostridiales bacterium]|jgi:glycine cleavage system H protein|nr:glycine cleavage system protein GcvH [Clostridiales bacterium]